MNIIYIYIDVYRLIIVGAIRFSNWIPVSSLPLFSLYLSLTIPLKLCYFLLSRYSMSDILCYGMERHANTLCAQNYCFRSLRGAYFKPRGIHEAVQHLTHQTFYSETPKQQFKRCLKFRILFGFANSIQHAWIYEHIAAHHRCHPFHFSKQTLP